MFTRHQALITGLVLLLGLSAAACASAPPKSSAMRLGAMTMAPEGFVAFCRRVPTECLAKGTDPEVARQTVEQAAAQRQVDYYRQYWKAVFSLGAPAGEGATASTRADAVAPPFASAAPPLPTGGAPDAALGGEPPKAASGAAERAIALDAGLWARLNKVNSRINRAIERSTDADGYGVVERWSLPLAEGLKKGDCEDYALEKRRALIAEGVPQHALSIAVAETGSGERHAVLVVATDSGDYVLDNLTPWIVPWAETAYRWKARQTSASLFDWATIAAS